MSFEGGSHPCHPQVHRSECLSRRTPAAWVETDPPRGAKHPLHQEPAGLPSQECAEVNPGNTCAGDRPDTQGRLEKLGCRAAAQATPVPVVETNQLLQGLRDANKLFGQQRARRLHKCFVKPRTQSAILLYIGWRQGFLSLP